MNWDSEYVQRLVQTALEEDVGAGDATVLATIPAKASGKARILAREDLVCAGLPMTERVFRTLDPEMQIAPHVREGALVQRGDMLLHLNGKARAILTGERAALNFLGRLSGIATLVHQFVQKIEGTRARIRDTRKTTPGLRLLEKYAVKAGGGTNHRIGLYDAILLKENHIALAGGVKAALDQANAYAALHAKPSALTAYEEAVPARATDTVLPIQIEVRDERELREALAAGAESVLLDNMSPAEAKQCVALARSLQPECIVEISGGITLENVRAYAETGADFLSSGSLTHSAPAVNLSLLVDSIEDK
ncbi:MAG TPA: carboxylating nicotinate-nucleotide diphosphorylase [Candidatus Acidoferrum sp.]|nr:carboxylating nicotinate-nucleotide diphosphorylase [Candidatus Acidoferrum sp.]